MTFITKTLCIESSYKDKASAICACLPAGAGMFDRPYGTVDGQTGEQTIVGYISHGLINTTYSEWLDSLDLPAIVYAASQSGLSITEQEVFELLDNSVNTTQGPHQWLSENGYVLL